MDKDALDNFSVSPNMIVREAMKKLDESNRKILFIIDHNNKLFGTLTDGDIRRWILSVNNLESPLSDVCNSEPIYVLEDYKLIEVKELMLNKRIQAVPVLNRNKNLLDLLFWDTVFGDENQVHSKDQLSLPVVIMAGGAGTRLDPFTRILPKPLIPIGDRSIMEVIIDQFRDYGIEKYFISVHHKSKVIKAYFDELAPDYEIEYLEESEPLGTAGGLGQLRDKIKKSFIVTNCDTVIKCDYGELTHFHKKNNYDITLVGSMINYKVPYGTCEIEKGGKLKKLVEKPEHSFLVSTGMYVMKHSALKLIPPNTFYNITDLIKKVNHGNGSVGVFPISEKSWLDTGEWHEYKKALEQLGK